MRRAITQSYERLSRTSRTCGSATIPSRCTRPASRRGACVPTCAPSGRSSTSVGRRPARRAALARLRARRGARHRRAARPPARPRRRCSRRPRPRPRAASCAGSTPTARPRKPICSRRSRQPRYAQVRAQLAAAAAQPRLHRRGARTRPPTRLTRRRAQPLEEAPAGRCDKLGDNPPDEALHAVRMRAKQCRYAAEACEPAFGKPARRLATRDGPKVQDVLGEHHDAVVAAAWLAKTAHECSPAEAYAIGMLAQVEREAAAAARAEFPARVAPRRHRTRARLAVSKTDDVVPRRGRRRRPAPLAGGTLGVSSSCTGPATTTGACPRASSSRASPSRTPPAGRSRRRRACASSWAPPLPTTEYVDRHGRPKIVHYWRHDTRRRRPRGRRTTRSTRRVGLRRRRSRDTALVRRRPPPGRDGRRHCLRGGSRVTIYLVRHAKAGERNVWDGDDRLRPLSGRGHLQARGSLDGARGRAVRSAAVEPVRALHGDGRPARRANAASRSNPSMRSPKARRSTTRSRSCDKHAGARRGASARTATSSRCCSQHYANQGVDIGTTPQWPKGSTWVLETDATGEVRRLGTSRRRPTDSAGAPAAACGGSRPELRPLDSSSGPGTSRTTTVPITGVGESSSG